MHLNVDRIGSSMTFKNEKSGETSLMMAARSGKYDCLLALLKAGADVNVQSLPA